MGLEKSIDELNRVCSENEADCACSESNIYDVCLRIIDELGLIPSNNDNIIKEKNEKISYKIAYDGKYRIGIQTPFGEPPYKFTLNLFKHFNKSTEIKELKNKRKVNFDFEKAKIHYRGKEHDVVRVYVNFKYDKNISETLFECFNQVRRIVKENFAV